MKIKALFIFFLTFSIYSNAQDGFQIEPHQKKVVIPFRLINNLIFIPVTVNGVELNFLLDTGVDETILLSIDDKEDLSLNDVEKINLRGLGKNESIEGLKSSNNKLSIKGLVDKNHTLFIVLDQSFNFSSHIGIPVNGILGYSFFKNNLIEINYDKKRITFYESIKSRPKKLNNFTKIPITIEKNKPYATALIEINEEEFDAKLLLDIGNTDAIWVFQGIDKKIEIPAKNFDDFLGTGFSGGIFGKRVKISKFKLNQFEFDYPIIAMPDAQSVKSVNMVQNRIGSIGSEIFKRFTVVFDYKSNQLYLRKGHQFNAPFHYNMSGIDVENDGMQWVKETVGLNTLKINSKVDESFNPTYNNFKYKFLLKPTYVISNVRENSEAYSSGIRIGDRLVSINKTAAHKYTLQEIIKILKSEDGKYITIEVERRDQILKFKFKSKDLL